MVVKANLIHKSQDNPKKINPTGILVLEDGSFFRGYGFGFEKTITGEICFNTSITGYQEIISDPSYAGQIINFTFPHIGNVGTNDDDHESDKIWTRGIILNSEISNPSNYRALKHLDSWLKKNKIVGITGLDTRSLTNLIRDKGAPKGTISYSKNGKFNIKKLMNLSNKWSGLKNLDLAEKVTTKKNYKWSGFKTWKKEGRFLKNKIKLFKIVAIDYGIKKNILRYFSDFRCEINIVSCKTAAEKILKMKPDGIFLSNGPGDPAATGKYAIGIIKILIKKNKPIFGICLGHQLLSIALGAKTFKLKFGHRGINHPVQNIETKKIEITSQNHGFAVELDSLSDNVMATHINLNDNTCAGIESKEYHAFSVQYHPESSPGPHDSRYLFDKFIGMMNA